MGSARTRATASNRPAAGYRVVPSPGHTAGEQGWRHFYAERRGGIDVGAATFAPLLTDLEWAAVNAMLLAKR